MPERTVYAWWLRLTDRHPAALFAPILFGVCAGWVLTDWLWP